MIPRSGISNGQWLVPTPVNDSLSWPWDSGDTSGAWTNVRVGPVPHAQEAWARVSGSEMWRAASRLEHGVPSDPPSSWLEEQICVHAKFIWNSMRYQLFLGSIGEVGSMKFTYPLHESKFKLHTTKRHDCELMCKILPYCTYGWWQTNSI